MCEDIVCCMFVGLLIVFIYLIEKVNCKRPSDTLESSDRLRKHNISKNIEVMTDKREEGVRGATGVESTPEKNELSFSSGRTDPLKAPLSILIKVTKIDGESLPYGEESVALVEEIFLNGAGVSPYEVLILNDQDALVDLPD